MSKDQKETRILVTYQSQTGNTRKVAEAIYEVLPEPKEIRPLKEAQSLEEYSLIFLGFPVHGSGPNPKATSYLENNTKDKQIALFITHAAPEDAPEMPESVQKFCDAAGEADILDVFHCQGQLSSIVKTVMRFAPDPQVREWAKMDNSKGQPDASRLEKAASFAKRVMEKQNTPVLSNGE
ncbi:MAG: flavodoxin family protein [Candidatus Bathyarchaeota archaeon]|nr:flavodoxin family protein [Candidatus Bathyarchaeota archaeon]